MKMTILAGIFVLSASTALAQTNPAPEPLAPAPETAPSTAPAVPAPADQASSQAAAGGPANICQELTAFMKAPPPEEPAAAAPAKPAAPAQKEETAQQEAPAQQVAPAGEENASALAGTTSAGEDASAKPEQGTNSAQAVTGQDGVATDAPAPTNETVAAGSVANAPQKESRAAPLPPADVSSTPKESVMTVEAAEELAAANDIAACQDMARRMRIAGVSMPPPLIALAALDLQYQQNSEAGAPPAASEEPSAGEQAPAPIAPDQ